MHAVQIIVYLKVSDVCVISAQQRHIDEKPLVVRPWYSIWWRRYRRRRARRWCREPAAPLAHLRWRQRLRQLRRALSFRMDALTHCTDLAVVAVNIDRFAHGAPPLAEGLEHLALVFGVQAATYSISTHNITIIRSRSSRPHDTMTECMKILVASRRDMHVSKPLSA